MGSWWQLFCPGESKPEGERRCCVPWVCAEQVGQRSCVAALWSRGGFTAAQAICPKALPISTGYEEELHAYPGQNCTPIFGGSTAFMKVYKGGKKLLFPLPYAVSLPWSLGLEQSSQEQTLLLGSWVLNNCHQM